MPYPRDENLKGLAAATFHCQKHPHEIDHPAPAHPQMDEMSPLPTWTIEQARLGIMRDGVDSERLPKPRMHLR